METTYNKFFREHPEQKAIFDKEYAEFLKAESILEKQESERIPIGFDFSVSHLECTPKGCNGWLRRDKHGGRKTYPPRNSRTPKGVRPINTR